MNNAIEIKGISKKYILGHRFLRGMNFREALMSVPKKLWNFNNPKGVEEDDFWALKDINLSIKQGDAVGLIGPNGAGKSTFLKILTKVTSPTNGYANIFGRIGSLLEVGTGFHHELTGRENIYLNGAILGMRKREIDRKFDEIVEFSEMEKFLDTPVKKYSSGMAVKLAFSVAAHLEPEILIIDEVLAVGDVRFQKKCLGKMQDVAGEGRTVILVSHNMQYIRNLCNVGVFLKNGEIKYSGSVDEAIKSYLNDSSISDVNSFISGERNQISDMPLRFNSIRFEKNTFFPDESFEIGIKLHSNGIYLNNFSIELKVSDEYMQCVYHLDNRLLDKNINFHDNANEYVFSIEKLALKPGAYYISLRLMSDDVLLDKINPLYRFEVHSGNVYNYSNSESLKGIVQTEFDFRILR